MPNEDPLVADERFVSTLRAIYDRWVEDDLTSKDAMERIGDLLDGDFNRANPIYDGDD